MKIYDSKYIESDAILIALDGDKERLIEHLGQFELEELSKLRAAATLLEQSCTMARAEKTIS